jgi:hypothetical protein
MPISSKSREVVRLEHARASSELSKACRRDVERLRATLPREGGTNAAIEERQVECTRQSFDAWREAYVRAFETEDQHMTIADIEEITRQMQEAVRAQFQAHAELAPRTMTLGFREKLDQLVREQRQELMLTMKRMERDRAFPRKAAVATNVYNVTGQMRVSTSTPPTPPSMSSTSTRRSSSENFARRSTARSRRRKARGTSSRRRRNGERAANAGLSAALSRFRRCTCRPHHTVSGVPACSSAVDELTYGPAARLFHGRRQCSTPRLCPRIPRLSESQGESQGHRNSPITASESAA